MVRCSRVAATPTIAAVPLVGLTAVVLVVMVLVLLGMVVGMVGWRRCVVRLSSDERAGGGAGAGAGTAHARGGWRVVVSHTPLSVAVWGRP